ncbi:MAG TPA: DUF4314 domain-containing protein, partial [Actinoplanes sp.]
MTAYQPGQRIRLVHTADAHTDLRPGALGTVQDHNVATNTVDIAWDNGSRLSMLLDRGDRIAATDQPNGTSPATAAPTASAEPSPQRRRDALLTAAQTGGNEAGRNAADWWGQHTVGGLTTSDVRAAAHRVLTGIDDGDPQILDTLPVCDRADAALHLPDVLDTHGVPGTPQPTGEDLADALDAYADAYGAAAEARVVELCRHVASPPGTDLTHLHPDRLG